MAVKSLPVLLMIALLLPSSIVPAYSQILNTNNLSVNLELSPTHIETKNSKHKIGYVNLVNLQGTGIKAPQDVTIKLKSENPSIASVPKEITIPKGFNYQTFEVNIGNVDGETSISAILDKKIDHQKLLVGGVDSSMPDNIDLKINLPSNDMHVNSEMPFSVYLESEGNVIRAPYDVKIRLDIEESLVKLEQNELEIKKGEYYTWGVIKTFEDVGNAFVRASYDRFDVNTAENIEITSSLPAALKLDIFPKRVAAEPERDVDIFVSLLDSEGNPAVTPEDVHVELFSDNESVGRSLEENTDNKIIIKKGEFGHHFREEVNLQNRDNREITIGASADNLGIASDVFMPVQSLNIDHPKAENTTMSIFVLDKIPSNTTSIMVYQLMAEVIKSDSDEDVECEIEDIECIQENSDPDEIEHAIDELEDGEMYPIQGNEYYQAEGILDKINVVSSDNSIIDVIDPGRIESTGSYGTAIIKSGQKIGDVTIAATIEGIGAAVNSTKVVDVFKHSNTKIFSPTGQDSIVLDKNGYFDLFLIALDGKSRPKILENEAKYILKPVNEVLMITEDSSFAHANFHSDSFNVGTEEPIIVKAVPVGVNSENNLEEETAFNSQVSSVIEISLPFQNLDGLSEKEYEGIVELKDLLGNPNIATKDLRIKLALDGTEIVEIPQHVIIQEDSSYATFPITPLGKDGEANIMASVKGVIGSEAKISTISNLPQLSIFTGGFDANLELEEPTSFELFIDDENTESVQGASVKFITDDSVTVTPSDLRTDIDGGAVVDITAHKGPTVSIQVIASADGYVDDEQTFDYEVNAIEEAPTLALGLPEWVIYVGLAAVIGIVAVIVVFLKKPKPETDEDDEYEYEYEDEI